MSLYLCNDGLIEKYRKRLGDLNTGKGCIRFKNLEELPLDLVRALLKESAKKAKDS